MAKLTVEPRDSLEEDEADGLQVGREQVDDVEASSGEVVSSGSKKPTQGVRVAVPLPPLPATWSPPGTWFWR